MERATLRLHLVREHLVFPFRGHPQPVLRLDHALAAVSDIRRLDRVLHVLNAARHLGHDRVRSSPELARRQGAGVLLESGQQPRAAVEDRPVAAQGRGVFLGRSGLVRVLQSVLDGGHVRFHAIQDVTRRLVPDDRPDVAERQVPGARDEDNRQDLQRRRTPAVALLVGSLRRGENFRLESPLRRGRGWRRLRRQLPRLCREPVQKFVSLSPRTGGRLGRPAGLNRCHARNGGPAVRALGVARPVDGNRLAACRAGNLHDRLCSGIPSREGGLGPATQDCISVRGARQQCG